MDTEKSLVSRLVYIMRSIDEGSAVRDTLVLGLPFMQDGQACSETLSFFGFKKEKLAWVRPDGESYFLKTDKKTRRKRKLADLEAKRIRALKRAEDYGVCVYIPTSAEVLNMGLSGDHHPAKFILRDAPRIRLLFEPGVDQQGELAFLLATQAVSWAGAMRIAIESHASNPVSKNATSNMDQMLEVLLNKKCTEDAEDRAELLLKLSGRYGKLHEGEPSPEKDAEFKKALEPYLREAFLHESIDGLPKLEVT